MGQKLVTIKFEQGSSSIFWNQKYNPVFKIEISRDGGTWIDVSNLEYCLRLLNIQPSAPILPEVLVTEQLTNSKLRKIIQKGQSLAFFVDDDIFYYRISFKDDFLTTGQWEELNRGDWGGAVINYTPLEYIESTGTQYIDTGITLTQDDNIEVEFALTENQFTRFIFGRRFSSASGQNINIGIASSNNRIIADFNNSDYNLYRAITNNGELSRKYKVILNKNVRSISSNNTLVTSNTNLCSDTISTNNALIFSSLDTIAPFLGRIYSVKISSRGDFIPCKDPNGVVCMYDKVSRQFFYNQGTGDFIAGPVIIN